MTEQRQSRIALLAVAVLLFSALLGFLVSDDSSAAGSNNVVGFVDSDSPSGVSVVIIDEANGQKHNTSTNPDGSFEFLDLDSGEYVVRYTKSGYLSVRDSWSIPADLPITDAVTMVVAPTGATTVTINVKDGDGEVVENASVYLMSSVIEDSWWDNVSVGYTVSQSTDAEGNSSFESLTDDKYDVRVEADGYYTNIGSTDEPNITLTKHNDDYKQTIRVYDTGGNPLGSATVFMYDTQTSTWTDAEKVGYTYYLKPEGDSDVFVYAYHSASDYPAVEKLSAVSAPASFNMHVGVNSASDDDVIYVPSVPSNGSQSVMPKIGDRIIKLNTDPTAAISITNGFTDVNGTHVVSADSDVNFSGSPSTSAVGLVSYDWSFTGTGSEITKSFSSGSYDVTLTVTDTFGFTNATSISLLADGEKPIPAFTATVKSSISDNGTAYNDNLNEQCTGQCSGDSHTVVFDASGSTDNSEILTYEWDIGGDSKYTGDTVSHSFIDPGTVVVKLNVTDVAGNTNETSLTMNVKDITPPVASFNWSYELGGETFTMASIAGLPTHFNAGSTTDNSEGALTYNWDFGDGSLNASTVEVDHIFENTPEEGFNVVLTVTDASGNDDVYTYNIKPMEQDKPDIFISEMSFSNDNPTEGDKVNITLTMDCHCDKANVTVPFQVTFYLDQIDNSSEIDSVSIDPTNITDYGQTVHNASIIWTSVSGVHTIYAMADSMEEIDESHENNEISRVITVSVSDDSTDWTSIALILIVVLTAVGAVAYIYQDKLFG